MMNKLILTEKAMCVIVLRVLCVDAVTLYCLLCEILTFVFVVAVLLFLLMWEITRVKLIFFFCLKLA